MHKDAEIDTGSEPTVSIALATYNGARYIDEQIQSYLTQSHKRLELVVSDDGSTDNTLEAIEKYSDRLPIAIRHNSGPKGILRNFETALSSCRADYIALSDQDDVWHVDKVLLLRKALETLEARYGKTSPALVFCDLEIVADDLSALAPSFFKASIKSPTTDSFLDYVLDLHVPGCAVMINRALLERALPFPDVYIHDWWLMLVAQLVGKVAYVDHPLIRYRQHAGNAVGLAHLGKNKFRRFLEICLSPRDFISARLAGWRVRGVAAQRNLRALEERFGDQLQTSDLYIAQNALSPRIAFLKAISLFAGARTGLRSLDMRMIVLASRHASHDDRSAM